MIDWNTLVLAVAEAACTDKVGLVKLVLAVNRFTVVDGALLAAPRILDDQHYRVDWRGFWSEKIEKLIEKLVAAGKLTWKGACLKPVNPILNTLGKSIRKRIDAVTSLLGPLTPREIDAELARAIERSTGIPILLDHVVGVSLRDLFTGLERHPLKL